MTARIRPSGPDSRSHVVGYGHVESMRGRARTFVAKVTASLPISLSQWGSNLSNSAGVCSDRFESNLLPLSHLVCSPESSYIFSAPKDDIIIIKTSNLMFSLKRPLLYINYLITMAQTGINRMLLELLILLACRIKSFRFLA